MKIYTKKRVHGGLFVIECPKCKAYLASASEVMYLPQFSVCSVCNSCTEPVTVKR